MTYEFDDDRWGLARIERPARRIIDAGLGEGRSVIEPDVPAWSSETTADLRARVVSSADSSGIPFMDKLRAELQGAPRATYLLTAELLALHVLPLSNVRGPKKVGRVDAVLSWMQPPAVLPADLCEALDGPGVLNGGVGFNVQIWNQLAWLLTFVERWHTLDEAGRNAALKEPWTFRELVHNLDTGQVAIRNSLLYLAFPDVFLPIVRQPDKVAIRNAFAEAIGGTTGDDPVTIDRDLFKIHAAHREQAGNKRVDYYQPPWRSVWDKGKTSDKAARAWLIRDKATNPNTGFVALAAEHFTGFNPDMSRDELNAAVENGYKHLDYAQRLAIANDYYNFLFTMKADDLVTTEIGGDLHIGVVTGDPEYSNDDVSVLRRPVSWTMTTHVHGGPLRDELGQDGTVVDITGTIEYLKDLTGASDTTAASQPTGPVQLPAATKQLADDLHFDQNWLQKLTTVLQDRKQVVLYGPPGTGKTYLARRISRHITDQDAVRLVQFHPSYSYEDFFEGFRPRAKGDAAGFELVPGPLRQLAARAEADKGRPYVLIIDEINRANLAKVFGELYFLLEYRDEKIDLQYSPGDRFKLPSNIFFIGTMNTADRSVAGVDAAMRRRFAFLELHPDQPPVRGMLARWSSTHKKNDDRATLLDRLNAKIEAADRDFKIGPSYLMKPDADHADGLDLIWEHSILPLLEEHYYDRMTREAVRERFGLKAIRAPQQETGQ